MNTYEDLPILYLVIPCYNEEKVLPITAPIFLQKINTLISQGKISDDSRILFVNDASTDSSWEIICVLAKQDIHYTGISQSRNRGHQSSLLAGLMEAKDQCDITISIDCDGQDDINAVDNMIIAYMNGCDIVYGVRQDRSSDTFFKRFTAESFYKFLCLMGAETVFNHADYRLLSNRVLQELENFKEVNLYLRGIIPLIGFKCTSVYYKRYERMAGKSHYSMRKMLSLALNGILNLSIKPIRIITVFGFTTALISFLGILYAIIPFFLGKTVSGWTSTICLICFLGGIQLLSLGVVGEYVGKIYLETKKRPPYIISEKTEEGANSSCSRKTEII